MRYLKEIVPYNRFWGNCITNMLVSILHKEHPSYEPLIYMNAYEYSYLGGDFHIDYTQEYYNYFFSIFYTNRCNFINRKDFVKEFKEILINNLCVTLNVDLFYWNKQGSYYNILHRTHFSFVIGFDDEADIFYVLEDDVDLNYAIREIPTEDLIQAFLSEYKDNSEDFRILTYKDNEIKPYTLEISQVIMNAQKIIHSLDEAIEKKQIIDIDALHADISNMHHFVFEFGKISNRLSGNILLFEELRNNGMIGEKLINELIMYTKEICKNWALVKNIFLTYCLRNKISDIDKVEKMIIDLFINEKEMWLKLIKLREP